MGGRRQRVTTEERLAAVHLVQSGEPVDKVAGLMGVGRRTIFDWMQKYREHGRSGVQARSGSGRPSKLTAAQTSQLAACMTGSAPADYGLGGALWTRALVQKLLTTQFGVTVSRVTASRLLESIGVPGELPLCSAFRQSLAEVRMWEEEVYPGIRAEAADRGAEILFLDEMEPDDVDARVDGPGTNGAIFAALTLRRTQSFRLSPRPATPADFVDFCRGVAEDFAGPLILITNVSALHTAAEVAEFVRTQQDRLKLVYFPHYG